MDQGADMAVKLEGLHFDIDSLDVQSLSEVIMVLFRFELGLGAVKGSLNGHSTIGDDASTGKLSIEVWIRSPGLELVVGVTELLGRPVATYQYSFNSDGLDVDVHHLVGPVGDFGQIGVNFDYNFGDNAKRRGGSSNGLVIRTAVEETYPEEIGVLWVVGSNVFEVFSASQDLTIS